MLAGMAIQKSANVRKLMSERKGDNTMDESSTLKKVGLHPLSCNSAFKPPKGWFW